jgi:tetratricopeptide (TPR) repeat protein
VLQGQAVSEGGTPYQLWQQVLKNLVLLNNVDLMEASILKPVVDGVDALLEMPIPNPPDLTPESAQKRLHNTIASLLRRVSGTVLILLEDLHWASSESLGLLTHLNRLAPQLSVLLIGTYRDDEYPHFRASLPEMRLIHLARLAQEEIVQLSHSMIGDAAKSHHVADFLQRETEGNVYFLIEVVRALAEEAGQLDRIGRMTLPERVFAGGVQQIVQRRLARVSDSTRRLLNLAAVAGRILDEAILQVAVPEADLTSWLTECADAAILEVRENRWRFAHDKLRETLLAGLTEVEQAALHRTVASALEQVYPQAEEYLSALAHHWRMAGDQDKEIHYAELAAQQALKTSANRQAIPLLKRVLELFPSRENAEDHLRYAQLQLLLGRAHLGLSAFTEARQYFYAALSIAEQFDDQKLAAYALDALGNIAMRQGDFEGGRVKFEKSLELFQALDWKEGMARPLNNLGIIKRLAGEFEAAQSYLKRSMEVAAEVGWKEGIAHPLVNLGIVHSQLAEFEASNHAFEQALLIYQEIGAKAGMVRVYNNLSTNAARQQKFEEAKEHLHHALALARETNEKEILAIILLNLGTLAADKMQLQEAYSHLCESLRTSMEIGIIPIAVQVMPSFAKVFLKLKAFERAAEIIMFTIQHPQCTSETRTSAEDEKQQVEKAQPELDWETAIAKAKTFSIEQLAETLFSENPVP